MSANLQGTSVVQSCTASNDTVSNLSLIDYQAWQPNITLYVI